MGEDGSQGKPRSEERIQVMSAAIRFYAPEVACLPNSNSG
jgi:hypothetical protein